MKKLQLPILGIGLALFLSLGSLQSSAQIKVVSTANPRPATSGVAKFPTPSPLQLVNQQFGLGEVNLEYSRPSANGRTVFGDLVPYDKLWRTGANASTKIQFTEKVAIQGRTLEPGTYAIYTTPGKTEWTIHIYSDLTLGGNVAKYDPTKEIVQFKVPAEKLPYPVETFTIDFDNVQNNRMFMNIKWATTHVRLSIEEVDMDKKVMNGIGEVMSVDSRPYFQAANYYYTNNKDQKTALEWVNKALESNPTAFWMLALKAKIQLKLNDKAGARETAQKVIDGAKAFSNSDYVAIGEKLLKEAK